MLKILRKSGCIFKREVENNFASKTKWEQILSFVCNGWFQTIICDRSEYFFSISAIISENSEKLSIRGRFSHLFLTSFNQKNFEESSSWQFQRCFTLKTCLRSPFPLKKKKFSIYTSAFKFRPPSLFISEASAAVFALFKTPGADLIFHGSYPFQQRRLSFGRRCCDCSH